MKPAPIVLFVYNRPGHTQQVLNALANNKLAQQSTLIIYADGPKDGLSKQQLDDISEVRQIINNESRFNQVIINIAVKNQGLANAVVTGVTDVVNKYGKAIVLEDDLITSPFFLTYMNEGLNRYENNDEVISIHGFMYPAKQNIKQPFFIKGADCWGWATWKRGWDLYNPDAQHLLQQIEERNLSREFDFNNTYGYTSMLALQAAGKIDSWAIRWYASAFLLNKLTLYPPHTLVQNIGMDGSGTHKDNIGAEANNLNTFKPVVFKPVPVVESTKGRELFEQYFNRDRTFTAKASRWIKRKFKGL